MNNETYNLFIDESCHLEHDMFDIMCLGYIKVNSLDLASIVNDIKTIKIKHKTKDEIKWNKLSAKRIELYKELIAYFFNSGLLSFRCVLVVNKSQLNHVQFNNGSHNRFYYKMIYTLLDNPFLPSDNFYKVYLDIKDTRGKENLSEFVKVYNNKFHDNSPFIHFQQIRSHESELIQLTDLFIGAISFKARNEHLKENPSPVKLALISFIEKIIVYELEKGMLKFQSPAFNIFRFIPQNVK